MIANRAGLMLLIVTGLFALSGASCPVRKQQPLPPVLPPNATAEQVIEVVNRNNGQIQSFSTSQATLSTPGAPSLRTVVAFQRPLGFRMRGTYPLTGPELDLGSNNDLFWFWINRNEPKAVYYCRHDQFAQSTAKQMVPIQPDWLIDALGVSTFDTSLPTYGPYPRSSNVLEMRTIKETADGQITKITLLDASQGWILGQEIYNAQNQLLLQTQALDHRQDPRSGLWMPRSVKFSCPMAQFSMQLDLGNVDINVPPANPAEMFAMPSIPNSPAIDIAAQGYQMTQR
jgi:hypothetical protein